MNVEQGTGVRTLHGLPSPLHYTGPRPRHGQHDGDRRADASLALDLNRPAIQLDVPLRDCQSQSRAGGFGREIRLEDFRDRLGVVANLAR